MAPNLVGGGVTGTGYPALPDLKLTWGEFTGRLGLDWKTRLGFTDQTLLYAFYSRGYKGGGVNPPSPGFATPEEMIEAGVLDQATYALFNAYPGLFPILRLTGVTSEERRVGKEGG